MNYKIIETSEKYPNVLLYRDRDENGTEFVYISAIGKIENEEDMFAFECVEFENNKTAQSFINDYSKESAEEWCEENEIYY